MEVRERNQKREGRKGTELQSDYRVGGVKGLTCRRKEGMK